VPTPKPQAVSTHHLDRRAVALIERQARGTDDELIDTPTLALWLGMSPEWVEIGRSKGYGPPFLRLSPRRIRYRVGDVKGWLAERAYRHTAEYERKLSEPKPAKPAVPKPRRIILDPDELTAARNERHRISAKIQIQR
jgi:hypothetical protein